MNDVELLQAMAEGDSQALQTLYQRHGPHLLNYLLGQLGERPLAEEVLQDVMLAAWQGVAGFRYESSPRTWLFSIARHKALNARQRRRPPPDSLLEAERLPSTQPDMLDSLAMKERLHQALAELPGEQRETLELVFVHGFSGEEVARILGVAAGTVRSRLHRARARLQHFLERQEEVE